MIISREYIECLKNNTKLPFPYIVQLEINNVCPFNCPQCYKIDRGNIHMDFDKLKKFVEYCYEKGTRYFVLNGGEPMLYYRINDLLKFMRSFDIKMNCFTSGYGLTEDIINLWDFDNHKLCISLNGSTDEINSLSRQGFEFSIAAMEVLSNLKKNI